MEVILLTWNKQMKYSVVQDKGPFFMRSQWNIFRDIQRLSPYALNSMSCPFQLFWYRVLGLKIKLLVSKHCILTIHLSN